MSFRLANPLYDPMSLNISFFPTNLFFNPLRTWNMTSRNQDLMTQGSWYVFNSNEMRYHVDLSLNFSASSTITIAIGDVTLPTSAVSNSFNISTFTDGWLVDQTVFTYSATPASLFINSFSNEGVIDGDPVNFTFSLSTASAFVKSTASLFIDFPASDSVTFPGSGLCYVSPSPCTCVSGSNRIRVNNCFTSDNYGANFTVFIYNSAINPGTTKPSSLTLSLIENPGNTATVIASNTSLSLRYMIAANLTQASVTPLASVTGQPSGYNITFRMKNKMASTVGSVVVSFPKGIFKTNGTLTSSSGTTTTFSIAPANFDTLTISNCIPANTAARVYSFLVYNISNPETLQPIYGIRIETWSASFLIDNAYNLNLTIETPHTYRTIRIVSTNLWNLQTANYIIDVTLRYAHYNNDVFTIILPSELNTTLTTAELLSSSVNISSVTKDGNKFTFIFSILAVSGVPASTVLSFRFQNVTNSVINTLLGPFYFATNASTGYRRAEQLYSSHGLSITPGIFSGTLDMPVRIRMTRNVTYNFSFTFVNNIPLNGYFILSYPSEMVVPSPLNCHMLSGFQGTSSCHQNSTSEIIFQATSFISVPGRISFSITGNTNPNLNTSSPFMISTFYDNGTILDKTDGSMFFLAECDDCLTCNQTRSNCTSCILVNSSLTLLDGNVCVNACPLGKVNISGLCHPCNTGCRSCAINTTNCLTCLTSPIKYYLLNNICLSTCPFQYYANDSTQTCSPCINNCGNCTSEALCTSCAEGYVLLQTNSSAGQCLRSCPIGMTPIGNICKNCSKPCYECFGSINNCTSCIENFTLVGTTCLNCNSSQFINYTHQSCDSCASKCLTCSYFYDYCTSCPSNLYYYPKNNTCLSTCGPPFAPKNITNGVLTCDFQCSQHGQYYYSNGSCLNSCPHPFKVRNQSDDIYCDFPCLPRSFYYQNDTCLPHCLFPFTVKNYTLGLGCDFVCALDEFLYLNNNTCSSVCESPFVRENYTCKFPCLNSEYYYYNGSCLQNCSSPFYIKSFGDNLNTCNFPCPFSLVYFDFNQSCIESCPVGFKKSNSSLGFWCEFKCETGQYFYANDSCHSACPSPLIIRNSSFSQKYCDFPCPTSSLYYHLTDKSCQKSCDIATNKIDISVGYLCIAKEASPAAKVAQVLGSLTQGTVAGSSSVLLAGADPTTAIAFMSLLQGFYILLFYNVEYPENIQSILESFSVAKLSFLPRPMTWILNEIPEVKSPKKFYDNGYTGFFLDSASVTVIMIICLLATFLYGLTLGKLTRLTGVLFKFARWIHHKMDRSLLIRVLLMQYFELSICSLLQVLSFSTKSTLNLASSLIGLAFLLGVYSVPILVYKLLANPNTDYQTLKKYEPIIEDYDINDKWRLMFGFFVLGRKSLHYVSLIMLYDIPLFQTLIPWLLSLGMLYALVRLKPHHRSSLNMFDTLSEMGFFTLNSCVLLIAYLESREKSTQNYPIDEKKESIGWIMIGTIGFVLLAGFVNIWGENIRVIKMAVKKYTALYKNNKVVLKKIVRKSQMIKSYPRESKRPRIRNVVRKHFLND